MKEGDVKEETENKKSREKLEREREEEGIKWSGEERTCCILASKPLTEF